MPRVRPAWLRIDWPTLAVLYIVTVSLRLLIWHSEIYGDEAWHFFIARRFGADAPTINALGSDAAFQIHYLFWWRPLFELLLLPAAHVSFDAWRFVHILITSTIPVLGYLILRDQGARPVIANAAAAIFVVHPLFESWSVIVFPDGLLTTAYGAALWSLVRNRTALSAAFLLAAVWVKEVAIVGVALLFLYATWEARRNNEFTLWPLRLSRAQTSFLGAAIFGLVPLVYYLSQGGQFPGWSRGGDPWDLFDRLFLLLWLAPLVFVGLAWRRTRRQALLGLIYPAFFLLYRWGLHRGMEIWYYLLPSFLAVIAAAFVLEEWWTRASTSRARVVAWAPRLAAAAVLALFALQIFAPSSLAYKGEFTMPVTQRAPWSLRQTIHFENTRDVDFATLNDHLGSGPYGRVLTIDLPWFFNLYPFGERAGQVLYAYSSWYNGVGLGVWTDAIERTANLTIVATVLGPPGPFSDAIRATYGDCITYQNPSYTVIAGQNCPGRQDQLAQEYQKRKDAAG